MHVRNTNCQVLLYSCLTVDSHEFCPCLSNTFRVKRSPKKSPLSDLSPVGANFLIRSSPPLVSTITLAGTDFSSLQESVPVDETPSHMQDDHATDEEKLASSTAHKWAPLQDVDTELNSEQQDFPQPCDLTSFVNENSLPPQAPGEAPACCCAELFSPLLVSMCLVSVRQNGSAQAKYKSSISNRTRFIEHRY